MVDHSVQLMTLAELFDGRFRFDLPWFQRAYCWPSSNVMRLVGDVMGAMEKTPGGSYCLGTIMLARKDRPDDVAVIDGHQRLMTLTILFAVLRDLETDSALRAARETMITRRGSRLRRTVAGPHLQPPDALRGFVNDHVQAAGATMVEPETDRDLLSDTERNVIDNRDELRQELMAFPADLRRRLAIYLDARCTIIVRLVGNEDAAWKMLQTEDETRVEFNATDRAKASVLSVMPASERLEAAAAWDDCERMLGQRDTYLLLGYIRTIRVRKRRDSPVESDLCRQFELNRNGLAFMREHFAPNAHALAAIRSGRLGNRNERDRAAAASARAGWIERHNWIPPALRWVTARGAEAPDTALFFEGLDRLAWMMRLGNVQPAAQENRFIALIGEIERVPDVDDMPSLEIDRKFRSETLKALRSARFGEKNYAMTVLRRISTALGEDPGPPDKIKVTLEHVRPRNPPPNSGWIETTGRRQPRSTADMLGNLTILTRAENQKADTLEWPDKRKILARSDLLISRLAAEREDWNPEIRLRTDEMIAILFKSLGVDQ